jgi:hypothetical protein
LNRGGLQFPAGPKAIRLTGARPLPQTTARPLKRLVTMIRYCY